MCICAILYGCVCERSKYTQSIHIWQSLKTIWQYIIYRNVQMHNCAIGNTSLAKD